jgi:hypothetical protein
MSALGHERTLAGRFARSALTPKDEAIFGDCSRFVGFNWSARARTPELAGEHPFGRLRLNLPTLSLYHRIPTT